jgi:nickel-dependent lactate racemase
MVDDAGAAMSTVRMAYGEHGYDLAFDDALMEPTVILPVDPPAAPDPHAAFLKAVRSPHGAPALARLAKTVLATVQGRDPRIVIAIADHTRPVPDRLLVPWLVAELGVPDSAVTILVGTGTHRGPTPIELERMLGAAAGRFTVVNHDCHDPALVHVGDSSCGGACWLNRRWVEADLRLATGFIEPHFYAGFSGGSKSIVPGIAGLRTVQHFHRAALIADPATTWGDVARNPLQRLTREMTALCPPHAIVNVTLNRAKAITGVFAGAVTAAHDAGCAAALHEATTPVPRRFPVVVTTNSGHPLDQNFYQTVKGISAAARIVEPDGTILALSRCDAGLPDEGEFRAILADPRPSPELHRAIRDAAVTRHDQWQVQTLLQCLEAAQVVLYSGLSAEQRRHTRTGHTEDPAGFLRGLGRAAGRRLPVAVLPLGPLTIPVVRRS